MDFGSLIGLVLGVGGVVVGQVLEGGSLASLLQPTAFVIVFIGTLGASILQSGFKTFWRGFKLVKKVFFPEEDDYPMLITNVGRWGLIAWRDGALALENQINQVSHPFARKALRHVVDNIEPAKLRSLLETEIQVYEDDLKLPIKVWESAGGYSPTIGILGAVMGLIHVMENLSDPSQLGSGIAVAFVATIYGVGLANLVYLPIANRLKAWLAHEVAKREMLIEAFVSIAHGEHPRLITERMSIFMVEDESPSK